MKCYNRAAFHRQMDVRSECSHTTPFATQRDRSKLKIINKQRMTTYTRNGRRGTMINDNLEMKTTTLMGISLEMLTQLATCTLTSSTCPHPQPQL